MPQERLTNTSPVQKLQSQMTKVEHEDQGPLMPPQKPETSQEQSPSQPVSPPQQPESNPRDDPETKKELPEWVKIRQEAARKRQEAEQQAFYPQLSPPNQSDPSQAIPPTQQLYQNNLPHFPALQSLARQLNNHHRGQDQKFHLVLVPDDAHPRVMTFDTIEELIAEIQNHLDTPTSLFPVMGNLMRISKPPHRYLQTPFGVLPLFVLPGQDELEFEQDGFVGEPEKELAAPAPPDDDDDDYDMAAEDTPESDAEQARIEPPQQLMDAEDDSPVLPSEPT